MMQAQIITTADIDWKTFLSQHDFIWDTIPPNYYAGAILGNGLLGTNFYASPQKQGYRLDIGRSDVNEMRPEGHALYYRARLPIGYFEINPVSTVSSEKMRLSLYDATANATITTEQGSIDFKTYVDANKDVIVVETTGKETDFTFNWKPSKAISPRTNPQYTHTTTPKEYLEHPNPEAIVTIQNNINLCIQELYSGYTYVTAWKIDKSRSGNKQNIYITVSFENSTEQAITKSIQTIQEYVKSGTENAYKQHLQWWHNYYPASFVHFAEAKVESFYWIQQYKLACLTRSDKQIIDLMGPWTHTTPWPAIWWNLNTQLTYSPLFTANRLELSEPVWSSFKENLQSLINNVPEEEWRKDAAAIGRSSSYNLASPLRKDLVEQNQYEVGNLTWMMYYYWLYCDYKNDRTETIEHFYPLLKRCIAYYMHIIYKGDDGKYHLPLTASPEYKPAEDCNYDLAILRWGLTTLLQLNTTYSLQDSQRAHWRNVLANLVDYPRDEVQGFIIGKDVKLTSSHRHYSHLLMIYPFRMITPDNPDEKEIIYKSLHHWIGQKGALQGYSYTGASSICSFLRKGDKAIEYINALLDKYIQPNTLYKESGPVIETPLSAVTSLQELYLYSYNNILRVFPAVPNYWREASFVNFRAPKGLLVSATRSDYKTVCIQVEAPQAGKYRIQTDLDLDKFKTASSKGKLEMDIIDYRQGIVELTLKAGEVARLSTADYNPESPLFKEHTSGINSYGLKK
ncbi:hypothetical protein D0T85_20625 [Bacteroides sp. 519]|nr:hypothetical protein [Bacteroides sp. 519]